MVCRTLGLHFHVRGIRPLPAAELPQTGALAPAEALQLMDTLGDKLTVIDVRTEQEYAQGHVPGALLLPIQTLREHMGQVPADGSRPAPLPDRTPG